MSKQPSVEEYAEACARFRAWMALHTSSRDPYVREFALARAQEALDDSLLALELTRPELR